MSAAPKSRWAEDDAETKAHVEQRKREKEQKKREKEAKQRKLEEAQRQQALQAEKVREQQDGEAQKQAIGSDESAERPLKRRRLSNDTAEGVISHDKPKRLLQFPAPEWGPCRHVDNFEQLNAIEEGSYGWVSRAKDARTGEVVAIKKLKMENAYDGFPVTGLREIETLLEARHPNIVMLREVVMGDTMDE